MKVNLKWITPDADKMIAHMARVSNPNATEDDPADELIAYLIKHKHWSPFEMAGMCVEIETTRDIARQILRHRSFHFQEFSQRYSVVDEEPVFADTRLQDVNNRQNSFYTSDKTLIELWNNDQKIVWDKAYESYKGALGMGVAKELARKLLPEGLTKTRMYMHGTIRDWIHYVSIRSGHETQLEHRDIAFSILKIMYEEIPSIMDAAIAAGVIDDAYDTD